MTTAITQAAAAILPIGDNQTLLWGMTARERLRRIAAAHKLAFDAAAPGNVLLPSLDYAFAPAGVGHLADKPGTEVPRAGGPVPAHSPTHRHDRKRVVWGKGCTVR